MDIIQTSNGTVEIRGYAPSTDSFSSDTTTLQLSLKSCNLQPSCTASASAPSGPACNIYPVDMSFAGNAVGLVTDRCTTSLTQHSGVCSASFMAYFLRLPISLWSLTGTILDLNQTEDSCRLHTYNLDYDMQVLTLRSEQAALSGLLHRGYPDALQE